MLFLMHQSPTRGELRAASGKPIKAQQLALMVGAELEEVEQMLQHLLQENVTEKSNGAFVSRRMLEDERKAQLSKERVQKHRKKVKAPPDKSCNGVVTPNDYDSDNDSNKKITVPNRGSNVFKS